VNVSVTRRNFLKSTASAPAAAIPGGSSGRQVAYASLHGASSHSVELLRRPDFVSARFGGKDVVKLDYSTGSWTQIICFAQFGSMILFQIPTALKFPAAVF
jgi:TAT (twin-arginine translocation) pathway signal sequence